VIQQCVSFGVLPGSRQRAERRGDIDGGPVGVLQVRPRDVVEAVEWRESLVRCR
jgi:hypothetical protein